MFMFLTDLHAMIIQSWNDFWDEYSPEDHMRIQIEGQPKCK